MSNESAIEHRPAALKALEDLPQTDAWIRLYLEICGPRTCRRRALSGDEVGFLVQSYGGFQHAREAHGFIQNIIRGRRRQIA